MKKCNNCNKEYEEAKNIKLNLGFARIEQSQCPYCHCPIDTKIIHKDINGINTHTFLQKGY